MFIIFCDIQIALLELPDSTEEATGGPLSYSLMLTRAHVRILMVKI